MCPICEGRDIKGLIRLDSVPTFCNMLYTSKKKALEAGKGSIHLFSCHTCGYVFNKNFDPDGMNYSQEYENSLFFSPHFKEYSLTLAKRLIDAHDLRSKNIIEIGCGKGDFLKMLCDIGGNKGVGFDPSFEKERIQEIGKDDSEISVVRDYYSEKYAHYTADLIVCRQVLEHIADPKTLTDMVQSAASHQEGTVFFFEVPNFMYILRDMGIWDLIYEHCGYYTKSSLAYLFCSSELLPINVQETFGGQYISIEAHRSSDKQLLDSVWKKYSNDELLSNFEEFSKHYQNKLSKWKAEIEQMKSSDSRAVVWGGGSKGVTFLNVLNIEDQIEYVVDVNPHKQNKFIPGTGQQIVSPDFLRELQPDTVIVMNPNYADEIKKAVRDIGLHSKLMTA
jgi:2-polyprenyl-3-methyl-5-hydroxy-6-metoxy-1,4-benzoquinol methylase